MTPLHIQVAAILTFSSFSPLFAQQPEPTPSQIQDLESTNLEAARQWAQDNAVPEVLFLDDASIVGIVGFRNAHPVFFTTHNHRASSITKTSRLYEGSGLGLNLDGSNLTLGIWDASIVYDRHQEHNTRIIPKETGGTSNHAHNFYPEFLFRNTERVPLEGNVLPEPKREDGAGHSIEKTTYSHALLPVSNKGSSDWSYSWIPVIGPILGGILAALAYGQLGS